MCPVHHQIIEIPENIFAFIVIHDSSMAFMENSVPHWHNELELICSLDSHLDIRRDHEHFVVMQDNLVLIESGQIHTVIPVKGYENHSISIAFKTDFLQKYGIFSGHTYFDLNRKWPAKMEMIKKMKELDQIYRKNSEKEYRELKINSLLFSITYLLFSNFRRDSTALPGKMTQKYRERYCNILKYMEDHYNEPLTLNVLSVNFNLSREYISREFKYYIGKNFRDHLSSIRLSRAHYDLLNSDLTIMEIAVKHGFNNQRNYNHSFEKQFGITPAKYRRIHKRRNN